MEKENSNDQNIEEHAEEINKLFDTFLDDNSPILEHSPVREVSPDDDDSLLTREFFSFLTEMNNYPNFRKHLSDTPNWIGISSCGTFCERKQSLLYHCPGKDREFDANFRVVLDIGNAVHDLIQTNLGKAGILYGAWRCPKCAHVEKGFYPEAPCECSRSCMTEDKCIWPTGLNSETRSCVKCPYMTKWEFRETKLRIHSAKLVGKYDGLLVFQLNNEKVFYFLEIKTIGTNQYEWLSSPYKKHKLQLWLYIEHGSEEIRKIFDLPDDCVIKGRILYIDKGGRGTPKEYVIDPNPEAAQEFTRRVEKFWSDHEANPGKVFPRTLCKSRSSPLARYCNLVDICMDKETDVKYGVIE